MDFLLYINIVLLVEGLSSENNVSLQFHCVACDHSSEMFGFVKEVFKTCAKDWSAETLAKELDCVRRIFQESEDSRGKKLRNKAEELRAKLDSKNCVPVEVCDSILLFLTGKHREPAAEFLN